MPSPLPRLWVIATPIGNPGDLSPRARETLENAYRILAEDTRRAARLLQLCGVNNRRLVSFFEHNEADRQEEVLRLLREGHEIALISDAGTPLLSDPGYRLVRACRAEGIPVSPVPGPSAPAAALSAAGLPPLPHTFLGFLPRDAAHREKLFASLAHLPGTLVFFERKDRLKESLAAAFRQLGQRDMAVCRELTKPHEEFIFARLENWATLPETLRGELTILIAPGEMPLRTERSVVETLLAEALRMGGKSRDVARRVQAGTQGWSGKEIYALLEEMKNGKNV